jgi:hypothetical protein
MTREARLLSGIILITHMHNYLPEGNPSRSRRGATRAC